MCTPIKEDHNAHKESKCEKTGSNKNREEDKRKDFHIERIMESNYKIGKTKWRRLLLEIEDLLFNFLIVSTECPAIDTATGTRMGSKLRTIFTETQTTNG